MLRLLAATVLLVFANVSFSDERLDTDCSDEQGRTFLNAFNSLAQGKKTAYKKSILVCEAEAGNSFAAILLAENYKIFKVNTVDLYALVREHAKEGDHKALTIRGLADIDPKLGILVDENKPSLKRWYAGDPYNYEEAAKFFHQYHNGREYKPFRYFKYIAYAYLYHAHELGSDVAKSYMDKLVLKMDERELSKANKLIEEKRLINESAQEINGRNPETVYLFKIVQCISCVKNLYSLPGM